MRYADEVPPEFRRRNGKVPQVIGTRASDVVTKPVEWLWDKRIPKGKLTMFDGDPDVGKSVVTMDLTARVSTGRTFPDGAPCETGNVLIVNVEDAKDDTIVPRLKAHCADLERIVVIDGMPDEKGGTRLLDLPDDVESLKVAVEHYEAALLIIDPVLTMLGGDANKDQDARKALAPLRDMAEETGVTIVAVRHLNKNVSLSAIQRGGGNMGLIGVARAGAFFAHHPEEDGLRVMAPHKSNLAEKQPSLQYVIKGWAIDENIGRVEWKGITEHDANSLASGPATPLDKSRLEEAKEFLYEELKDGPMWAKAVYRDANDAGVARRTLEDAKSAMRVRSEKIGTEGWQWSLPEKKDTHHDVRDVRDVGDVQNGHHPNPAKNKEGREGREGRSAAKEGRDVKSEQRHVPTQPNSAAGLAEKGMTLSPGGHETRVVNVRKEPYDVYIGRGHLVLGLKESDWHNPFKVGTDGTREEVIEKFERYLTQDRPDLMERLPELEGKTLACWCKPEACHGDVLVRLLGARMLSSL